jgi:hypothetical protein
MLHFICHCRQTFFVNFRRLHSNRISCCCMIGVNAMVDHWRKTVFTHLWQNYCIAIPFIYLHGVDRIEFKTCRRDKSDKWLSIIDCAVCCIKYCTNLIHNLGYWIINSSMVIDLGGGGGDAAFFRFILLWNVKYDDVHTTHCSSILYLIILFYNLFSMHGSLAAIFFAFQFEGYSLPTSGYWHVQLCVQVYHKQTWMWYATVRLFLTFNVYGISAEEEMFLLHKRNKLL